MNKIKFLVLLTPLFFGAACFRPNTANTLKTPVASTSAAPTVEKSVEKSVETPLVPSKGGDYNAALNYYNAKNYAQAAVEFGEVVKKDAKNQQAYLYLGKSQRAAGKTEDAVGAFQKAIELKPEDAEANYELGSLYRQRKDYQTALPFLQKAAKVNYKSVDYLMAVGDNYRDLKKCDYAVVPYGEVNGFDPKNTAAYYGMGLCYIELKNKIAAAQQVRNLEKLDKKLSEKLAAQIPQ